MALTEQQIRALKPQAKAYRKGDRDGLYLQVTPSGGKHWRLNYSFQGKQKTASFGSYPEVNLYNARQELAKAKDLLRDGIDPNAAKKADGGPSDPEGETFQSVATRWFKLNKDQWASSYYNRMRNRMVRDCFPEIGGKPVASITPADVLACIRKIEERGAIETGRRIHQIMGAAFRFAVAENLIPFDPSRDIGSALAPKPKVQHRAAMPADQIGDFLKSLDGYRVDPVTVAAMRLVIFTVVRTSELRFAEWSEFEDLDGKEPLWRIAGPKMKMRRDHLVPLSRQAVQVLKELKPLTGHQRFVFLSQQAGMKKPISENTMLYTLYRSGHHSRATTHGFRSSFSTWSNESGWNRDWIEMCLAHVDGSVRSAYNHALYLGQRRKLLQAWADFISPPGEFDDIL
ncbi:tyrosine-type recombinase/integrase [Paracoccus methylarcula]|uniref:DUF4102 domain-containing protein n=1 Tax=Paracoccus methylarcula TaxID=72022 RepID=A0A422QUR7_9RHOB|nr:integrase arm-type DNA-binding domain-containing protein [Paracoccus methylarcula]RNF33706.1 DUF4102 domain-containing protein [Paracoccus methylarcula]